MNESKLIKLVGLLERLKPYFSHHSKTEHLVTWIRDQFINSNCHYPGGTLLFKFGRITILREPVGVGVPVHGAQIDTCSWQAKFNLAKDLPWWQMTDVLKGLIEAKPTIDRLLEELNTP